VIVLDGDPLEDIGLLADPATHMALVIQATAEFSRTWWDMIRNLDRAEQAGWEVTDATRTAAGIDAAMTEVSPAQRVFLWVGIGSL
jgi:hypothetical protein